jgi:hypothetical protein
MARKNNEERKSIQRFMCTKTAVDETLRFSREDEEANVVIVEVKLSVTANRYNFCSHNKCHNFAYKKE